VALVEEAASVEVVAVLVALAVAVLAAVELEVAGSFLKFTYQSPTYS
jgi:hypothetical protein